MNALLKPTIRMAGWPAVCFALACNLAAEARENNIRTSESSNPLTAVSATDPIPVIDYGISPHFCNGGNLILTCTAANSYQWFKDGVPISESDTASLTIYEAGAYTVVVDYGNGPVASQEVVISQSNAWTGLANDGDWLNPANWSCGEIPLASDLTIIDDSATSPVISGEELMQVQQLEITGSATLRVESGSTLWVTDAITVGANANLIIEDRASLVQVNEVGNAGNITARRSTTPMKKYDFTYWSSPVGNQTLQNLSPATLADKYYSFSPAIGNWVSHLYGAVTMEAGKGYIVRAPQTYSPTVPAIYDGSFTGTPNNGTILAPVSVGISDMNLIGNPYPSAIDIDAFLSDPANSALIDGTIYLWTHNSAPAVIPGDNTYNYTANDYAAYNLLGGLATSTLGNNQAPEGKVASGQAFFTKAFADGNVVFRNDMRVAFSNAQFYRNAQTASIEKHRLWLSISNDEGAFKQTLLGYVEGATNGIDRDFDGLTFNGQTYLDFYSLEADAKLSIQGRALPFDAASNIALGYSSAVAGAFVLSLDRFDGLFEQQNVFLYDHETGNLHDLRIGGYPFNTAIGTFNNRFELRFVDQTMGNTGFSDTAAAVIVKNKTIGVQATAAITEVGVYDLSGRLVYENRHINNNRHYITDLYQNGVFIIKIKLGKGNTIVKKIMI